MALSRIYLKLHSHGRLLAARIGILPFFFLKSIKKETRAIEEELKGKMPILTAESSSVAIWGGGFGLPIGMQSMQNTLFLLLFETNFCTKSENIPPIGISNENVTTLTLDLKRILSQNSIPTWTKTFFLVFT